MAEPKNEQTLEVYIDGSLIPGAAVAKLKLSRGLHDTSKPDAEWATHEYNGRRLVSFPVQAFVFDDDRIDIVLASEWPIACEYCGQDHAELRCPGEGIIGGKHGEANND